MERLKAKNCDIPDFPKPGINFKDIMPLVADANLLKLTRLKLVEPYRESNITLVAGMKARGFIFSGLVAAELAVGFILLRKLGTLSYNVETVDYTFEYGAASLEAHTDAIKPGVRLLLIDDLLATGATAKASCQLLEKLGVDIIACAFVIELAMLDGRKQLTPYPVHSLIQY